jgi:5-formyltetrahydrofolate cyclo-ligase
MVSTDPDPKPVFRQKFRQLRQALGPDYRHSASLSICSWLAAWPVFQRAHSVLTYLPMKNEVDLRPLLADFPDKRWALPRILPGIDGEMMFHRYDPQHLVRHPFGMEEPAPYLPGLAPETIELVLVPGLAYDRHGWRLGYGGGYYDRFLARFDGLRLGVVFADLLVESIPYAPHDMPMHWLVTEHGLLQAGPPPP